MSAISLITHAPGATAGLPNSVVAPWPHRRTRALGTRAHQFKGVFHAVVEALLDFMASHLFALGFLSVLKIGYEHATRIAEDIWNDEDTALVEDVVGRGRRWRIGPFGNDPCANPTGILLGDRRVSRRGDQHVAIRLQYVLQGNSGASIESLDLPRGLHVFAQPWHVQPVRIDGSAADVGDRHDSDPAP
jgi:hypothetical protein